VEGELDQEPPLRDKTVVITGGNSGIGRAAAVELARMGARVVITSRSSAKGAEALTDIRQRSGSDAVDVAALELGSFASIRSFASSFLAEHERLDVLVNNAGAILSQRQTTADGFEATFGVNHLGHFLLTELLLERLKDDAPSRIINVSSIAHRFAGSFSFADPQFANRRYNGTAAYNQSKLANILFTHELARRLAGTGVTANCLHPGAVASGFGSADDTVGFERLAMTLAQPFLIGSARGARTIVYLVSSPHVAEVTGGYFVRRRRHTPSRAARDPRAARRLWELSEELIASADR
jgi:NAD(P)-dependent dehydrogenase (short-subunit alcohol dehydrogenase family)